MRSFPWLGFLLGVKVRLGDGNGEMGVMEVGGVENEGAVEKGEARMEGGEMAVKEDGGVENEREVVEV